MSKKLRNHKPMEEILKEALVLGDEQPYEIPDNWVWVYSEYVANWGSGGTPSRKHPEYYGGIIPWVKTGDLNDAIVENVDENITEEGLRKSSAKLFPKGAVVIAMYGATIGKLGILDVDAATNQACAVAVPLKNTTNKFMFYYFKLQRQNLINMGKGGAQPNISQTIIKKYPFVLPPIEEQERIVEKVEFLLNKVDEVKQSLNEAKKTFALRRVSILEKAFRGELLKNNKKKKHVKINSQVSLEVPDHWEIKALKDVVKNYNNQRVPVSQKKREEMQGDIPYYGATGVVDFVNGYTHEGEFVLVGEDGANLLSRSKPQAFIVKGKSWVNNHAHVLSMNGSGSNSFLMHYLNYLPLNDYVTGTAQPKLNRKNLDSILMVLPPKDEQIELSNKINKLLSIEQEALLAFDLDQLNILKQAILSKAFRGELGTNDPSEDSAVELLLKLHQ